MKLSNKIIIFNISGGYAVGKDAVLKKIIQEFPNRIHRVSTLTTRPVSKEDDPTYEGVTFSQFKKRVKAGRWMLSHQISGNLVYGTNLNEIIEKSDSGLICLHSVYASPDGVGKLRELFGSNLFSINLIASHGHYKNQVKIIKERLIKRGREDIQTINLRLSHQVESLKYAFENPFVITQNGMIRIFDLNIVNEDLDITTLKIINLFKEILKKNSKA